MSTVRSSGRAQTAYNKTIVSIYPESEKITSEHFTNEFPIDEPTCVIKKQNMSNIQKPLNDRI